MLPHTMQRHSGDASCMHEKVHLYRKSRGGGGNHPNIILLALHVHDLPMLEHFKRSDTIEMLWWLVNT